MSYQVVAPLVIAKDHEGRPYHVYEGGVIQWLSDEQAAHFLGTGLVVKFGTDGDVDEAPNGEDGDKPAEDATKAELVAWVSANVVKDDGSDYSEAELNRMNKDQLWELINAVDGEG